MICLPVIGIVCSGLFLIDGYIVVAESKAMQRSDNGESSEKEER